jgi:Holliday junction resolvase RusA-like endonuclease
MKLTFTIPGPPVPKARARVVATKGGKARSYTPEKTASYQQVVAWRALRARQEVSGWPYGRALTPETAARFGLLVTVYHSTRGDWDNYGKAVSDACNGILWHDDEQVCDGRVVKVKVKKGEERAEIEVCVIEVDSRANMR